MTIEPFDRSETNHKVSSRFSLERPSYVYPLILFCLMRVLRWRQVAMVTGCCSDLQFVIISAFQIGFCLFVRTAFGFDSTRRFKWFQTISNLCSFKVEINSVVINNELATHVFCKRRKVHKWDSTTRGMSENKPNGICNQTQVNKLVNIRKILHVKCYPTIYSSTEVDNQNNSNRLNKHFRRIDPVGRYVSVV